MKEGYRLAVLMAEQNFAQAIRLADRGYVIVHGRITAARRKHLGRLPASSRARVAARSHARAIFEADHVTVDR